LGNCGRGEGISDPLRVAAARLAGRWLDRRPKSL